MMDDTSEPKLRQRWLKPHSWLIVLVAAFVVLATTYSITTPIFEAGDEIWHYPFVQHLSTGNGLPVQDPNVTTLWAQEGGQPPLYYAVSALATFWIDARDLRDRLWLNPEAKIGIPLVWGNKNLIVHTGAEDFPWRNTALAVHLIRLLSILFSAGTVALTYFTAFEIKKDRTLAAIATALVAFNPMFIFISASVNNDSLAVLLATLALWLLTRLVTRGATLRQFAVLGVVLGLGALAKVSDLGLLVVAALVFAYLALKEAAKARGDRTLRGFENLARSDGLRRVIAGSLLSAALVVVIAGWWYLRNWQLYGDPLAFNVWIPIARGRPTPATWTILVDEFQSFRISFWGNFGGVNIIAPDWVYTTLDALSIVAGLGLVVGLVRRVLPRLLLLPTVWLALIMLTLIRWTFLTLASQGRLIFPAISAVGILMAYGLSQWRLPANILKNHEQLRSRWQSPTFAPHAPLGPGGRNEPSGFVQSSRTSAGIPSRAGMLRDLQSPLSLPFASLFMVVLLFAFSLLAPFSLIAPTYALPPRSADDEDIPNLTHIVFGDGAELVGYALPQKAVAPGQELALTLYWRALEPIDEDFSVYIDLFDSHGDIVGSWNAFPGGGLYPTRLWQPGQVIADSYRVPVALDARGPGVGRIEVGLFRRLPLEKLVARDPQGRKVTPNIARYKISSVSNIEIQNPVRFEFANQIALVGYSVENATGHLNVRLYWRARQLMDEDYTVFVHLDDRRGHTVAQKDDQPQHKTYPTSFWDVGETVADDYELDVPDDVPAGDYQVVVGLYRAGDNTRLSVEGGGDSIVLATVPVRR
jgi:hypothetical protein